MQTLRKDEHLPTRHKASAADQAWWTIRNEQSETDRVTRS
jgi:hypothetical protein